MALFGSLATVRSQLASSENFKTAFAYVEACLRPGSPERALLDGLAPRANAARGTGGRRFCATAGLHESARGRAGGSKVGVA